MFSDSLGEGSVAKAVANQPPKFPQQVEMDISPSHVHRKSGGQLGVLVGEWGVGVVPAGVKPKVVEATPKVPIVKEPLQKSVAIYGCQETVLCGRESAPAGPAAAAYGGARVVPAGFQPPSPSQAPDSYPEASKAAALEVKDDPSGKLQWGN